MKLENIKQVKEVFIEDVNDSLKENWKLLKILKIKQNMDNEGIVYIVGK